MIVPIRFVMFVWIPPQEYNAPQDMAGSENRTEIVRAPGEPLRLEQGSTLPRLLQYVGFTSRLPQALKAVNDALSAYYDTNFKGVRIEMTPDQDLPRATVGAIYHQSEGVTLTIETAKTPFFSSAVSAARLEIIGNRQRLAFVPLINMKQLVEQIYPEEEAMLVGQPGLEGSPKADEFLTLKESLNVLTEGDFLALPGYREYHITVNRQKEPLFTSGLSLGRNEGTRVFALRRMVFIGTPVRVEEVLELLPAVIEFHEWASAEVFPPKLG